MITPLNPLADDTVGTFASTRPNILRPILMSSSDRLAVLDLALKAWGMLPIHMRGPEELNRLIEQFELFVRSGLLTEATADPSSEEKL